MYEKMICRVGHNELKAFVSYLREQERAEATISKYLTDMNTFLKFIGEDSDAEDVYKRQGRRSQICG